MHKIANPEVRIQYSRLLDPFFHSLFDYQQKEGITDANIVYNELETITKKIQEYKQIWEARKNVLLYARDILQLDFYQTTIDAYIVGFIQHAISTPIIIGSTKTPIDFADTLTHELLHRLVSDSQQKVNTKDFLLELFPSETLLCRNHIVIHAVLKKIYLEFLHDPTRLEVNIEFNKNSPDYAKAWEIVETLGEDTIISNFKNCYLKK